MSVCLEMFIIYIFIVGGGFPDEVKLREPSGCFFFAYFSQYRGHCNVIQSSWILNDLMKCCVKK